MVLTSVPRRSPNIHPFMHTAYRALGALLLVAALLPQAEIHAQTGSFHDHELTWVSPDTLVYPLDGKPNFMVRVVNQGSQPSPERFSFQFESPDYPNPGGGFATFPNGGYIALAPAETTWVQAWSSGVYEAGAPQGFFERDIIFRFLVDRGAEGQDEFPLAKRVTFENLGRPTPSEAMSGPMRVEGTVRNGTGMVRMELRTAFSDPYIVPVQSTGGGAVSFEVSVRDRDDWLLIVESDDRLRQVLPLQKGATEGLDIVLEPLPQAIPRFELEKVIETPTGFWRGAVSESEGTFVAFPGQENWVRTGDADTDSTLMASGKVQKYAFDGTLLWEHTPGWEIWGGDMSSDGRWVAYVINPTHWWFRRPSTYTMVVLDGWTGEPVWSVEEPLSTPVGRLLESLELAVSEDGRFIAVGGTVGGQVGLFDIQSRSLLWTVPQGQGWGQIRKLVFSGDHLYVGTGDNYLRKLRVEDGFIEWKAFIGGWPFVMGFDPQGGFIYTGTKSKNLTKLRDSDGQIMWQRETQNLDAYADPAGQWVGSFGPQIYDAETADVHGLSLLATKHFLADGSYFVSADRSVSVHAISGQILSSAEPSGVAQGPGEQSQWSYLTEDEGRVIILGRDMGAPPQPGIAIYRQIRSGVDRENRPEMPSETLLIEAYPNPFASRLRIAVEGGAPTERTITLFDLLGRTVLRETKAGSESGVSTWVLDTTHLAPGLYMLQVEEDGSVQRRAVVKGR